MRSVTNSGTNRRQLSRADNSDHINAKQSTDTYSGTSQLQIFYNFRAMSTLKSTQQQTDRMWQKSGAGHI